MDAKQRPMLVVKVFKSLMHLLMEGHEQRMQGDLNRTQRIALSLVSEPGETTMGLLGHHMNLRKGSVTSLVDGLEKKGLVRRRRDEKDRRIIIVIPTAEGRKRAGRIDAAVQETIEKNLSSLTDVERAAFVRAVAVIAETAMILETRRYGS